jgi:uncharacterized membrane protein
MSNLVVIAFDDELRAEEVRLDLLRMEHEHLVVLEDAVTLVRNREGRVKLRHNTHHTVGGAVAGGALGMVLGLMLLNPIFALLGLIGGTAAGAISGSSTHLGIKEEFMEALAEHLKPGTSALCVLVQEALDKVMEELGKFEGKVLHTPLGEGYEEKIQEFIDSLEAGKGK